MYRPHCVLPAPPRPAPPRPAPPRPAPPRPAPPRPAPPRPVPPRPAPPRRIAPSAHPLGIPLTRLHARRPFVTPSYPCSFWRSGVPSGSLDRRRLPSNRLRHPPTAVGCLPTAVEDRSNTMECVVMHLLLSGLRGRQRCQNMPWYLKVAVCVGVLVSALGMPIPHVPVQFAPQGTTATNQRPMVSRKYQPPFTV